MKNSYLQFAQQNLEAYDGLQYLSICNNQLIPFYKLHAWPLILAASQFQQLKEASIGISVLLQEIPRIFFKNDLEEYSKYFAFGVDTSLLKIAFAHTMPQHILYRPDFILTEQGWQCLEVNAGNAGGWIISLLASLYEKAPIINKYLSAENIQLDAPNTTFILFKALIKNILETVELVTSKEINIAIILSKANDTEFNSECLQLCEELYFLALKEMVPELTGQIFFCCYDDFIINKDGAKLNNKMVHGVYEEAIELSSVRMKLVRLMMQGKLHLNPGPITRFLNDKGHIAFLSEQQNSSHLTAYQQKLIQAYIPWTRRLLALNTLYKNEEVYLPDFVLNQREQMVLKKSFSHGGNDVYLGKMHSDLQWSELINSALQEKDFVVQELLECQQYVSYDSQNKENNYDIVWGAFIIEKQYAGGFSRIISKKGYKQKIHEEKKLSMINSDNADAYAQVSPIFASKTANKVFPDVYKIKFTESTSPQLLEISNE